MSFAGPMPESLCAKLFVEFTFVLLFLIMCLCLCEPLLFEVKLFCELNMILLFKW